MQSFVCGKYLDRYIIASRSRRAGLIINKEAYDKLLKLSRTNSEVSSWVADLLHKLGFSVNPGQKISEVILVRESAEFSFGRASYEITERCNYACRHCYLGNKETDDLSVLDKKEIIRLISKSGCLWLQITGGEPLIDKDFVEVYTFAYSLGLLITLSTNGSMLTDNKILDTLKLYPPYRLTISLYGATAHSYEMLTGVSGSFQKFVSALIQISETSIRTRINIITTKYNQEEIPEMINLARKFGYEYHVYSTLLPTLKGDISPTKIMSQDCESLKQRDGFLETDHYVECGAGRQSFHINSRGMMSICKTARDFQINILREGESGFEKLTRISEELKSAPSPCSFCELRKVCATCPFILKLYSISAEVPACICRKYSNR